MRHLKDHRKLSRTSPHRKAMLCNMVVSLIRHGRIETTLPKAKELRRVADRMVTLAKKGTLDARRRARRWVNDRGALAKLFGELGPQFAKRRGGYTRVMHLNPRSGDQAPMALIEYLSDGREAPKEKKAKALVKKEKSATKKTVRDKKKV